MPRNDIEPEIRIALWSLVVVGVLAAIAPRYLTPWLCTDPFVGAHVLAAVLSWAPFWLQTTLGATGAAALFLLAFPTAGFGTMTSVQGYLALTAAPVAGLAALPLLLAAVLGLAVLIVFLALVAFIVWVILMMLAH
jgi:hypothetical protein